MRENEVLALKSINKTYRVWDRRSSTIREWVFNFSTQRKRHEIAALKNIDLSVESGKILGIIGRNGSGKSSLLKIIIGAIKPDSGTVEKKGKLMRLELGKGFDGNLSARENVFLNGLLLGLGKEEIRDKMDEIIGFGELEEFVDTKLKYFSKGMKSRLAFGIAIHAKTDILLFDEFFGGVGDVTFKRKSQEIFLNEFIKNKTVVIVSHSLSMVKQVCDEVVLLEKGEIIKTGPPDEVVKTYEDMFAG